MDRVSGMKLESCVRNPEYLMKYSDIVILAARPLNIREIAQNHVRKDTLIISFMAVLPLSALSSFLTAVFQGRCAAAQKRHQEEGASVSSITELMLLGNW